MSEQQYFVTCCPQCQTAFRVTEEQIDMADGAVRCGACLRVFQAVPEAEFSTEPEAPIDSSEIIDLFWEHWLSYVTSGVTQLDDSPVSYPEMEEPVDIDVPLAEKENLSDLVSQIELEDDHSSLDLPLEPVRKSKLVWPLVVVLSVCAVLQFLWFNRDSLAQQPELRPWFLAFCQTASCSLSEYSDLSKLTTTKLIVRSHPTVSGALVVDAILKNSAQFRQLFPEIQLQFVDIRNTVVAARRFQPAEYLAGELKGLRYIPPATEVRFSLEIIDPGKSALGYNMQVVAAD